jgi:branched-chain amino acid aminotransferase
MVEKVDKIWLDGKFVAWDDANVHILSHTLHYGLGVFEGIRCYKRADGRSAVFRLTEHIDRLFKSALVADLQMKWSPEEVAATCLEALRVNGLDEGYIRPLVFLGDGAMGLFVRDNPVRLAVAVWRWGAYLGDEALEKGIRAKVSSFTRPGVNTVMTKAKVVGHYVNSILAKREVVDAGYGEAILLDGQGYVSEASGENIFLVKGGRLYTPPLGSSILPGITRDAVIRLCGDMDIGVTERLISRDEMYMADEVFFTGTAAEVTPVSEIDDRPVGNGARGPLTKRIQDTFFRVVRGPEEPHPEWLTFL